MRVCEHCGESLEGKRSDARFCSKRCSKAAWHAANREKDRARTARKREKRLAQQALKTCVLCGESLEGKRSDARFCFELCRSAAYYAANRGKDRAYRAAYYAANGVTVQTAWYERKKKEDPDYFYFYDRKKQQAKMRKQQEESR